MSDGVIESYFSGRLVCWMGGGGGGGQKISSVSRIVNEVR